jgi:hypothetical protein
MLCFRIKQNCCRVRVCEEHTQHDILGLLGFLSSHMVDFFIGEILLPLRTLLVRSLGLLLCQTVLSHMAWQSALEACTEGLTSLRRDIWLGLGCWSRNLRHILPWVLHNGTNYLPLGAEHRISKVLCLKAGTLHQELGTLVLKLQMRNLHQGMVQEWGSDKLTGS